MKSIRPLTGVPARDRTIAGPANLAGSTASEYATRTTASGRMSLPPLPGLAATTTGGVLSAVKYDDTTSAASARPTRSFTALVALTVTWEKSRYGEAAANTTCVRSGLSVSPPATTPLAVATTMLEAVTVAGSTGSEKVIAIGC